MFNLEKAKRGKQLQRNSIDTLFQSNKICLSYEDDQKSKIALFCNLNPESVIEDSIIKL